MTASRIFLVQSNAQIASCFDAFFALRPHLTPEVFAQQVLRQAAQGYQILALEHDGRVKSVAGFRTAEFLAWGKVVYIDDLSTLPECRGQGFAGMLLDWLATHAREQGCCAVHLDSGYARHAAHRLYLHKGFELSAHHLSMTLA